MIDAVAAGIMTSASKSESLYKISAANNAPANGARNTAPTPAPMPAANRIRRSLAERWRTLPTYEPIAAPI